MQHSLDLCEENRDTNNAKKTSWKKNKQQQAGYRYVVAWIGNKFHCDGHNDATLAVLVLRWVYKKKEQVEVQQQNRSQSKCKAQAAKEKWKTKNEKKNNNNKNCHADALFILFAFLMPAAQTGRMRNIALKRFRFRLVARSFAASTPIDFLPWTLTRTISEK